MDDASSEPAIMSLDLLREITNDFSEERKLGSGTFGKVYMGVHQDGEKIAVKKLYDMPGLDEENFQNEFKILTRLRHKNIVQLVGYCHDIQKEQVNHEGKLIIAERTHRALCLEYMSNGSLDKYLCDRCDKYDWHTDYGIIKGICEGLKYLHKEIKPPIYHLDLKPANVLLDKNMGPRIADFGMSRLFGDEQTRATKSFLGTHGYLPPEYIRRSLISNKFDIFSLGVVIIKIMAGREGYFNIDEMSSQQFINLVHQNWRNRLHGTPSVSEAYSEQIKICIEIGLSCVQEDRHKRPTIQDIVNTLKNTETNCTYASRNNPSLMYQDNLGNITQLGKYDPDHQQATPSRNAPSSSYNMEANRNTFPQHAQDPNDRHTEQIYHGSTFNQDILVTSHSNCFEENAGPSEARLDDGNSLPGIEGFQIVGDRRLGSTLRACGFPINGTTLCNFQWVHLLQDGTRKSIKGATMYDYVVTADDVGVILAVDCIPMDDNCHQGDLVREIGYYVTCDSEMQNDIDICILSGRADFDAFILPMGRSPDEWEQATLVLRRTGYQINFSHTDEVLIDEKYSPNLQTKIPTKTQFVLVSSGGVNLPFNTQGITEPNTEDNDVRLRDLIVLVMRTFQNKALLDATRKGNAMLARKGKAMHAFIRQFRSR